MRMMSNPDFRDNHPVFRKRDYGMMSKEIAAIAGMQVTIPNRGYEN